MVLFQGLDERKEIDLLFSLVEDLRFISGVQSNDRFGWLTVCQALRDIVEAFDVNDRRRLREVYRFPYVCCDNCPSAFQLLTAWSG